MSPPEARLWLRLRERALGKATFRRQHPVGPYVLDFYCAKARLAVEIDGVSHDMGDRPVRDNRRDTWLQERGIIVVRIPVRDLLQIDGVADAIVRMADEMMSGAAAPTTALAGGPPPPLRRGG
jgi:very-short-patch-repair endonuclease